MNRMKNKKLFIIYLLTTIVFFGALIRLEFSNDSYPTFSFSIKQLFDQFKTSGRFMIVLLGGILKKLNTSPEISHLLSTIMAQVCMTISLYSIYNIIKDEVKNDKLKVIVPILIVLNAFSIELFLFIEKGVMIFSIMMCTMAVSRMKEYYKEKNKIDLLKSLLYMMLANISYQGVVGIFIALALVFILKYSNNIKEFIVNNIITTLVYGIPALIDYILIRALASTSRVNGEIIITESIKKIISNSENMIINTYKILPKYSFLIIICIVLIDLGINIIKSKEKNVKKIINIFKVLYIICGTYIVTILPQMLQNTSNIWMVPRTTYAFASLFGILILYLIMNYDINDKEEKIIILLAIALFCIQYYKFITIETDRYKLNALDLEVTNKIMYEIEKYEKESGNTIKNIAIYSDKNKMITYKGISENAFKDLKAYNPGWAAKGILNYYSNREFIGIDPDEKIQQSFKEKNWSYFDKEQLIFEGDTLHLCLY